MYRMRLYRNVVKVGLLPYSVQLVVNFTGPLFRIVEVLRRRPPWRCGRRA